MSETSDSVLKKIREAKKKRLKQLDLSYEIGSSDDQN